MVHVCPCATHMWVSGDNLWCLHFETGYLTGLGFQVRDEQGAPLVTSPPPSPRHFDYKCEPPHLGFLWVLVIKLRSLHLWGKHVTNTVISSAPFSFSSPDSSCGHWLLPWWPFFKPSRWRFPVLLWKFPKEGQNKPFCFRSSHIRHLIMLVEAFWSGRSNCLTPQMALPQVCCLYFLNTAPWGAWFFNIFFREKT